VTLGDAGFLVVVAVGSAWGWRILLVQGCCIRMTRTEDMEVGSAMASVECAVVRVVVGVQFMYKTAANCVTCVTRSMPLLVREESSAEGGIRLDGPVFSQQCNPLAEWAWADGMTH
jgi:hypothetical protein